ncbi:unnamed protein product [Phytophthora fragariaefolia]|uniref:Unnamed protein product n=1 Tax=Phytophthora fragariaefolia TaxID=1490495 RepID=A0A9W6TPT3_9STRA|nr:unnamed protein product [Phytophthora fragariaefolia]
MPEREKVTRGRNNTAAEDLELARAWIQVSIDAGVGINQTEEEFWTRVKEAMETANTIAPALVSGKLEPRRWSGLNAHFGQVMTAVAKLSLGQNTAPQSAYITPESRGLCLLFCLAVTLLDDAQRLRWRELRKVLVVRGDRRRHRRRRVQERRYDDEPVAQPASSGIFIPAGQESAIQPTDSAEDALEKFLAPYFSSQEAAKIQRQLEKVPESPTGLLEGWRLTWTVLLLLLLV